ncbi:MAG: hypothetical protein KKB03_03040 [Nanoarchaeota archaeon]|nr:hypothetical protein [Nanoarchaeota archaeon]MBU1135133.1 hypothetical protein [Nanoarchaeota archaeon]MBU2520191.1 hypothetical protein [Nanoarchaeota archaeon]
MSLEHGKILKKSLKFAIQPKRWLPFFILDLIFLSVGIFYTLLNVSIISNIFAAATGSLASLGALMQFGFVLILLFTVWVLVKIWLQTSIIHQSYKEKDYNKSFRIGLKKYPSVLAAVIVIGLISGLIGMIPFIGSILSIIIGLMFFFTLPIIVVKNKGFSEALNASLKIFKKKAFDVFIIWLLLAIISMAIATIFALPLLILFINVFVAAGTLSSEAVFPYIIQMAQAYLPIVVLGSIILLMGMSITSVFSLKAQTEFYLKMTTMWKKLFDK